MLGINVNAIMEKMNLVIIRCFPRPFDRFLLEKYERGDLVGIEIGVFEGDHASFLLKQDKTKFMYLIDSYKHFNDVGYYHVNMEKAKKKVIKNLRVVEDKCEMIYENSDVAHKRFSTQSIDFVYIDGNHSYEQVKKDIENYFPLVKEGGIIGGHDFHNGNFQNQPFENGVIKAVMEFCDDHGYIHKLFVNHLCWWIIK